ncbi:MAG: glycoside hydrolase family 9 protein [Lachnospiraceae bacterium]|nr:glycoside hydrolase family 9 protein [Lachnospiraceae bacterium]
MRKRCVQSILTVFLCSCILIGCGVPDNLPVNMGIQETQEEIVSLGLTPEFNYEVPVSTPNIIVDQIGYAADSSKVAVFRGEILPDTYHIIDAQTEEVVYTGTLESKGSSGKQQDEVCYGDFTDFTEPGTYYLQAKIIGRSYSFVITDNPYEEIFRASLKQYYYNRCGFTLSTELAGSAAHNACHTNLAQLKEDATVQLDVSGGWHMDENGNRDVIEGCEAVNSLLLTYELYGDIFTDDIGIPESGNGIPDIMDEIKYEIDWLLKMQDSKSGAVYAAVSVIDNQMPSYILYTENITMDATIQFAATMAKFSYLYQSYDRAFATQCLKAADRAYRYVGQYLADVSEEAYFFAAAELYRATGNYSYRTVAQDFLLKSEQIDMDNDSVFLGSTTYLSTKQKVDVALCERVIKILLKEVEEIAYTAKNAAYLTDGNKEQDNNSELLKKMARLTVVDHVITNHEYATVLENHMHYFLGRNEQSISYIDVAGSRNYESLDKKMGIMKQIDLNAEFILMLSAIEEGILTEE